MSENVGERFIEMFPTQRNKLISIENILCSDFVWRKAKEISVPFCSDKFVTGLLTIGRFPNPKKMEDIPTICRGLLELGLDVK